MGDRKIKKVIAKSALLFIFIFTVSSSPVMAQMTVRLNGLGDLRIGSGGEFTFLLPEDHGWASNPLDYYNENYSAATHNGGIQTFCLEYHERLWQNTTYNAELSLSVKSADGYDTISKGSAWLYEQFASGTLESYTYDASIMRKISAFRMQKAIWFLEDEDTGYHNFFVDLVIAEFGSLEAAKADYSQQDGSVRVLRLLKEDGTAAQDQIIIAPPAVPAPGALMLGTIGVCLVRWRNKKRLA